VKKNPGVDPPMLNTNFDIRF